MVDEGPPGLAAERTALAWRRSGISVMAIGLATARGIPTLDEVPGRPVVGLLVVGLGAVSFAISSRQAATRSRRLDRARPAVRLGELRPVAVSTVLVSLGAAVLVVIQ